MHSSHKSAGMTKVTWTASTRQQGCSVWKPDSEEEDIYACIRDVKRVCAKCCAFKYAEKASLHIYMQSCVRSWKFHCHYIIAVPSVSAEVSHCTGQRVWPWWGERWRRMKLWMECRDKENIFVSSTPLSFIWALSFSPSCIPQKLHIFVLSAMKLFHTDYPAQIPQGLTAPQSLPKVSVLHQTDKLFRPLPLWVQEHGPWGEVRRGQVWNKQEMDFHLMVWPLSLLSLCLRDGD